MGMLTVIKTLPKLLVRNARQLAFLAKKAKPEILVFGGVGIATGAFVWAIFNARKLDKTLEETQKHVEEIESRRNDISDEDKPSIIQWQKDLNQAKAQSIWRIFYLMGLPAICFAGGMVMICGGHMILVKRFGALSSAFAVLQSRFNRYRQLNIAEHGEECDQRYLKGITMGTETTGTITDEDGVTHEVKTFLPEEPKGTGLYTFRFQQEFSSLWNRDPLINISFLKAQQNYWNARLGSGHVVVLKDVLEGIGIYLDPDDPMKDYIMIAGWRPNGDGDREIDFGIFNPINKPTLDLKENDLLLNFNCDGNIYHSNRYTRDGKKISVNEKNQVCIA